MLLVAPSADNPVLTFEYLDVQAGDTAETVVAKAIYKGMALRDAAPWTVTPPNYWTIPFPGPNNTLIGFRWLGHVRTLAQVWPDGVGPNAAVRITDDVTTATYVHDGTAWDGPGTMDPDDAGGAGSFVEVLRTFDESHTSFQLQEGWGYDFIFKLPDISDWWRLQWADAPGGIDTAITADANPSDHTMRAVWGNGRGARCESGTWLGLEDGASTVEALPSGDNVNVWGQVTAHGRLTTLEEFNAASDWQVFVPAGWYAGGTSQLAFVTFDWYGPATTLGALFPAGGSWDENDTVEMSGGGVLGGWTVGRNASGGWGMFGLGNSNPIPFGCTLKLHRPDGVAAMTVHAPAASIVSGSMVTVFHLGSSASQVFTPVYNWVLSAAVNPDSPAEAMELRDGGSLTLMEWSGTAWTDGLLPLTGGTLYQIVDMDGNGGLVLFIGRWT